MGSQNCTLRNELRLCKASNALRLCKAICLSQWHSETTDRWSQATITAVIASTNVTKEAVAWDTELVIVEV
jgi:hypothetical protein